jgi:NAD(P)-dependent dehydrogenase (short-subunit alcohol dehydrogenase family)
MQRFKGKVAIVTGAAGNVGQAVALALAREGASLALADRNESALRETEASLGVDVNSLSIPTDLIKPESVSDMTHRVLSHFKRVDVLANIAGGFTMGPPLHETSPWARPCTRPRTRTGTS